MGTKFAEEFPRERGTSFRRICELDPAQQVARCQSELVSDGKKDRTPIGVPPRGFPAGTIFAHKIPRKRQSLFGQKCELDPVQRVARCRSELVSDGKKAGYPNGYPAFLEAPPRFGLGVEVLQTFALPLGHGAIFFTTYGLYHKDFSLSIAKSKYFCLFINKKALPVGSAKLFIVIPQPCEAISSFQSRLASLPSRL